MNRILSAAIAAVFIFSAAVAAASSTYRFFPPANKEQCGTLTPLLSWLGEGSDVRCIDGETLLNSTLPNCGEGQVIMKRAGFFVCESVAPPACAPGEFLTYNGHEFACTQIAVPTCGDNQVLSFDGHDFQCVTRTDAIPSCEANQFLTYNGSSFQCANTQQLTIPVCAPNEVLTNNGAGLACTSDAPSGGGVTATAEVTCSTTATMYATCTATCPAGYFAAGGAYLYTASDPLPCYGTSALANGTMGCWYSAANAVTGKNYLNVAKTVWVHCLK